MGCLTHASLSCGVERKPTGALARIRSDVVHALTAFTEPREQRTLVDIHTARRRAQVEARLTALLHRARLARAAPRATHAGAALRTRHLHAHFLLTFA